MHTPDADGTNLQKSLSEIKFNILKERAIHAHFDQICSLRSRRIEQNVREINSQSIPLSVLQSLQMHRIVDRIKFSQSQSIFTIILL